MLKSVGVVPRLSVLLVLLAAAFALAGCGGGDGGGGGEAETPAEGAQAAAGAAIAPAGAAVFVSITTDAESAQWKAAAALLDRFPGRDQLIRSILEDTEAAGLDWETDIKPALGPEVDIVVLPTGGEEPAVVGLTQPADAAKLQKLVESGDEPGALEVVDGWTVVSDSQASIDAFKAGDDSLADAEAYRTALESLPAESLVTVFIDGEKLTELAGQAAAGAGGSVSFSQLFGAFGKLGPIAFALSAQPGGVFFRGSATQEGGPQLDNFAADLPSLVPADAVLYLGFANLAEPLDSLLGIAGEAEPTLDQQLAQAETFLGLSVRDDLLPLFAGEGALVVAPGSPIPAISLIVEVEDEQKAQQALDKLATLAGGFGGGGLPKATDIDGVAAQELVLEQFSVFYAVFDGKLVITSVRAGISGLVAAVPKLADDPAFAVARKAAGMPEETSGFIYMNLAEGIGLIEAYARLAGDAVPPEVSANLEPLGSFLAYSAREDGALTFSGFLSIE